MLGVKKDLEGRLIIESRIDLIEQPYVHVIEIWELDQSKRKNKRTRFVKVYDNLVGKGQIWQRNRKKQRSAICDVNWEELILGRIIPVVDFNAHSSY